MINIIGEKCCWRTQGKGGIINRRMERRQRSNEGGKTKNEIHDSIQDERIQHLLSHSSQFLTIIKGTEYLYLGEN